MASAPSAGRLAGRRARTRAALCGGPLALAAASLALPSPPHPTTRGRGSSSAGRSPRPAWDSARWRTPAGSRWRCSSPRRWRSPAPRRPACGLLVVRVAGLAALILAFRLAARAGGAASPGCSRSSRSSPAPSGCAICRRATSSRWSWPSCSVRSSCTSVAAAAGRVPPRLRWRGWRAPRCGPLVGRVCDLRPAERAALVAARASASHACSCCGSCPTGSARAISFHTFHLARISAETAQPAGQRRSRARGWVRGAGGMEAVARVDRGAVRSWPSAARRRDRTVAALALVAAGVGAAHRLPAAALGYPAVPRYLVVPGGHRLRARRGWALSAVTRLASGPRGRARAGGGPASPSAPRSPSHAPTASSTRRAGGAKARSDQVSALWRTVDQAQRRAPVARLHPVIEPSGPGQRPGLEARTPAGPRRRVVLAEGARRLHRRRRPPGDRTAGAPQRNRGGMARAPGAGMCFWSDGGRRQVDEPVGARRAVRLGHVLELSVSAGWSCARNVCKTTIAISD